MSFKQFSQALGVGTLTPAYAVKQMFTSSSFSFVDYLTFWNSLQRTQSLATKMLVEVVLKIIEMQRLILKRATKSKTSFIEEFQLLWSFLHIVRFIDLFLGVEPSNAALRKAQKAYETHRLESPLFQSMFSQMDGLLLLSFQSIFDDKDCTAEWFQELCQLSNAPPVPLDFFPDSFPLVRECSLLLDYPLLSLRVFSQLNFVGGRSAFAVFQSCASRLVLLSQPQQPVTPWLLDSILCALFLLKQCLMRYPLLDPALLLLFRKLVSQFESFPLPLGQMAIELEQILDTEKDFPGNLFRSQLIAENPSLSPAGHAMVEKFSVQAMEWIHSHRSLVVLYNPSSGKASLVRRFMQQRALPRNKAWGVEMTVLKEDLVVNLLESHLVDENDSEDWKTMVSASVRNRAAQDLQHVFETLLWKKHTRENIQHVAQTQLKLKQASLLLSEEDNFGGESGGGGEEEVVFNAQFWDQTPLTRQPPSLFFEFLEIDETNNRQQQPQKQVAAAATKAKRASLAIPGLEMFATINGQDAFNNKSEMTCPQRYVAYSLDFDELIKDARAMLPPGGLKLEKKLILRRVILGGSEVLHRALCTYVAFLAMDPELAQHFTFQFYVVPCGHQQLIDVASFMAMRDGWYRRHVFIPFAHTSPSPMVKLDATLHDGVSGQHTKSNPSFTVNNSQSASLLRGSNLNAVNMPSGFESDCLAMDNDASEELEELFGVHGDGIRKHRLDAVPGKLLRPLLENYVRQAEHVFPVMVFDCECWESLDSIEMDRSPDITIPFCQRVELGLQCALLAMNQQLAQEVEEEFEPLNLEEMVQDKNFLKAVSGGHNAELKLTTPELSVHLFTMGVDGKLNDRSPGVELTDTAYLSLILSSVPSFHIDRTEEVLKMNASEPPLTSAHPLFPWLEVQCIAHKSGLVELIKRKDKKTKDVDQIQDSLRFEAKTHHAGFVDIKSTLTSRLPFFIAIDGQMFGPYYRVRIRKSTALSASGGQSLTTESRDPTVTFPLMSFLPLNDFEPLE